ncbi:hypothetical protein TNCV_1198331 [Trichonephila clavipes]|uniref:Uncharacterized protein n=1 Tax=Trichonephila clavipes TaxID=2585209 RepID=A0A8X6VFE2_TRICX|nr:hypothetical protein TNCV_1198331 [Trichonephila clavipes]
MRWVKGEDRWEAPDYPQIVFPLQIGVEPSQIVQSPSWCSKLRLTTSLKIWRLTMMNFVDLDLMLLSIRRHNTYLILSRHRKPNGRSTKRRKMFENRKKRWQKSLETVDEKDSRSRILQRNPLSDPSASSQLAIFSPTADTVL